MVPQFLGQWNGQACPWKYPTPLFYYLVNGDHHPAQQIPPVCTHRSAVIPPARKDARSVSYYKLLVLFEELRWQYYFMKDVQGTLPSLTSSISKPGFHRCSTEQWQTLLNYPFLLFLSKAAGQEHCLPKVTPGWEITNSNLQDWTPKVTIKRSSSWEPKWRTIWA